MKQVTINKVTITLTQVCDHFIVRWRGEGGKNQKNERMVATLDEAEELYESWSTLARVNKGEIKPK